MQNLIACWRRALAALFAHKFLWIEETFLAGALLGQVVYWLSLPVSSTMYLVLHVFGALVFFGLVFLMWVEARRRLIPAGLDMAGVQSLAALPVCLIAGLGLPWMLVNWVPSVESLGAQISSAVARFIAAALLFTGSTLWWLACAARDKSVPNRPAEDPPWNEPSK